MDGETNQKYMSVCVYAHCHEAELGIHNLLFTV